MQGVLKKLRDKNKGKILFGAGEFRDGFGDSVYNLVYNPRKIIRGKFLQLKFVI